jgi:uncharacterized membrane protein YdfJ with MMPL/SSD domain
VAALLGAILGLTLYAASAVLGQPARPPYSTTFDTSTTIRQAQNVYLRSDPPQRIAPVDPAILGERRPIVTSSDSN